MSCAICQGPLESELAACPVCSPPDEVEAESATEEAPLEGPALALGILAILCLAYGVLGLGFAGVSGWHWALELKFPGGSEFALALYPTWVIEGLVTSLSMTACGIVLLRRGPRVKVALVCLSQVQLIAVFVGLGVSLVACAQFENTGPYTADAILRGLTGMVLPALLTVVALRPSVSRCLAGESSSTP